MSARSILMRLWRKAPVPVGLVCFALVVWFAGPLLPIGESHPLEPVWLRITIIAVAVFLVLLFYGIRYWRRRRATKELEKALKTDDGAAAGDGEVLATRMAEAIDTLKRSSGKQTFLYELPWYVIIGPPGAGKTTALVNSGLKFPLAGQEGAASIAGVGGTRYCDFWFTEDAVLIDTAGRYTTQDSDSETDRKSWLSFLTLLKQNRAKQPINGVILAISVEDLLTESPEELVAHTNAIRKRLFELNQELKIDFPVYALFTKADLVEGFREYFENFTEARRRKVWGHTFQTEDRKKNMVAQVPAEFDALVRRLTEELPDRLHEEPDGIARIAIFGFPAQFAGLRDRVAEFLNRIFEPTRYQTNANLRGFYFSSGTQEGTPIDQVLGAIGRNLAMPESGRHLSGRGKSFFLHDLLRNVIFSESGWVSLDRSAVRRAAILRYGTMALIGIVSVATLGAWGWSYASNKALIASVDTAIGDYRVAASDELSRTEISGAQAISGEELARIASYLGSLRTMPTGYAQRDAGTPLGETFGLSQRGFLDAASEVTYRNALERMLRSRLILRLEQQMTDNINDPMYVYEALKVYLMLGGKAPDVDEDYVMAWMTEDWKQNLLPGRTNDEVRKELEENLSAMLDLGRSHNPTFELNGDLVTAAQAAIARMKMSDRAYALIKSAAYSAGLTDFDLAMQSGADARLVFETRDGTDLSQVKIPGLYSYVGFHDFFFKQLGNVADKLESEQWVMGEAGKQSGVEDQFGRLGPELLDLYSRDFIATWEKALDNLKLRSITEDKPDYQVLAAVSSDATSPLRQLLEAIKAETALTQEREEAQPAEGTDATTSADVVKALANQTSGLERIGINIALKKSQVRAGEAVTGAAAATNPGANIEAYFKPYHNWVEGEQGSRPIDLLLRNLYDIRENLLITANYPSQAGPATEKLRLQVVNLRGAVSRLPKPFARMISEVVDQFESTEAEGTKAQMNQALANINKVCKRVTAGKYPFERGAASNAQIGEFAQLFGPGGLLDKYFADYLSPIVDMSGSQWAWKADSRLGRDLSVDTLRQFQRAADIRNAFFPDGGPTPNIQLSIAPNTISKDADMALLEVNQVVLQTSLAGNAPASFTWPGNGGSGTANISLYPEMPGRESRIGREGPWALMRLIDAGTVTKRGEELIARFVIGGREVSYKIRVGSSYNPLFLPALGDFKCPVAF